jgi:hypothetical protein
MRHIHIVTRRVGEAVSYAHVFHIVTRRVGEGQKRQRECRILCSSVTRRFRTVIRIMSEKEDVNTIKSILLARKCKFPLGDRLYFMFYRVITKPVSNGVSLNRN